MNCCNTKLLKYDTDQRKLERLASVEVMMPSLKDPERFSFWVTFSFFVGENITFYYFHCFVLILALIAADYPLQ